MQVSHETIYRALYVQGRGALKRELTRHLRRGRSRRYARSQSSKRSGPGKAHRDGDDLRAPAGGRRPRRSRPLGGRPSDGKPPEPRRDRDPGRAPDPLPAARRPPEGTEAERVADALAKSITTLPAQLRRSLTWDQGHEMAEHRRFSVESGVEVYFCDPQSPWQRGSNENTNGLLRQYFPQATEPRGSHPGAARRGRRQAQPPAAKDARLPDPGGEARRADRRPRRERRRALTSLRPTAFARQRSD